MTLSLSNAWDHVIRLLKYHGMQVDIQSRHERYAKLFGYNCMIANVRSIKSGTSRVRVNIDWFRNPLDKSKPTIRGIHHIDGFDFELIPTTEILYAIHYIQLRDYSLRLELEKTRWFKEPWWGLKVNQKDDSFVWVGGNTISFPLTRFSSPEALSNLEQQWR
ncbi:MAG: hypothetical protein ABSC04_09415 [Syntrophobacteraceae bacterium]